MSVPHPLNQAVVAQALHDLRNGQLRRCKEMGFGDADLDALKQPALVSVLLNTSISWCSVSINREVLQRLLDQVHDVEQQIAVVDRMLRLGASSDMLGRFYGLTHQEVALRRDILGLPPRRGRHPALNGEQDALVWQRWLAALTERGTSSDDEATVLDIVMDLAETMNLPMSVIWAEIQGRLAERRGGSRGAEVVHGEPQQEA